MNITEAAAWQRVAAFVAGEVDHEDEYTRQQVAHDLAVLDERAYKAMHAGQWRVLGEWDALLCEVTFEGGSVPSDVEAQLLADGAS